VNNRKVPMKDTSARSNRLVRWSFGLGMALLLSAANLTALPFPLLESGITGSPVKAPKSSIDGAQNEIAVLQKEIVAILAELSDIQEQIARLQSDMGAMKGDPAASDRAKKQLKQLESAKSGLDSQLRQKKAQLSKLQKKK